MKPRFFFQSPHNKPSGGTKVIHRIASLLDQHGYQSFVFSPEHELSQPDWMENPHTVISNKAMIDTCQKDDIIIGCWPDRATTTLIKEAPARTKVYFPQSNFTLRGKKLLGTAIFTPEWGYRYFWAVSKSNKEILDHAYGINTHVVHPYFFPVEWYRTNTSQPERRLLALARKGKRFVDRASSEFQERIPFTILKGKFTERSFIKTANKHRFFLHTAMGLEPDRRKQIRALGKYIVSLGKVNRIQIPYYAGTPYDEAFPLPPAEATLSGCIPIGFAKNGDLEWMNEQNAFIAKDRDINDLIKQLEKAMSTPNEKLDAMNQAGVQALKRFSQNNTLQEVEQFLHYVSNH